MCYIIFNSYIFWNYVSFVLQLHFTWSGLSQSPVCQLVLQCSAFTNSAQVTSDVGIWGVSCFTHHFMLSWSIMFLSLLFCDKSKKWYKMIKPTASGCYDLLPLESSLVTGQATAEQRGGTTGRSERQFFDSAIVTSQVPSPKSDTFDGLRSFTKILFLFDTTCRRLL